MAQNTRITCAAGDWTQITDADVAADISVMLANDVSIYLQATATSTPPGASTIGPVELLDKGDGWSEATIAEKFPGVSGALRLWAKPKDSAASVSHSSAIVGVSHGA